MLAAVCCLFSCLDTTSASWVKHLSSDADLRFVSPQPDTVPISPGHDSIPGCDERADTKTELYDS